MADWKVNAFTIGATDVTASSAISLSTNSAIAFSNSTDWDNDKKIQVGYFNHYAHIVTNTGSNAEDVCSVYQQGSHIQCFSGSDTACIDSGDCSYRVDPSDNSLQLVTTALNGTVPYQKDCVQFYFTHDNAVTLSPVTIWVGSGSGVSGVLTGASVYILEQGTASPVWTEATAGNKLSLTDNSAGTGCSFYIGMTAKVLSVGLHNTGRIKISATYS